MWAEEVLSSPSTFQVALLCNSSVSVIIKQPYLVVVLVMAVLTISRVGMSCLLILDFVLYQDSSRETIVVCSVTVGPGDGMVLRQGYVTVQHLISLPEVTIHQVSNKSNGSSFMPICLCFALLDSVSMAFIVVHPLVNGGIKRFKCISCCICI